MLKRAFGLVLLFATGHAFSADIIVNTTEDIVKNDQQCSLREAVEYINKGKPEEGLNGCGGKDASNNIILSNKEYQLQSQIRISKPMIFRTQSDSSVFENQPGTKNAVISMKGTDRIFEIERIPPTEENKNNDAPIDVSFFEITLKGCEARVCKDKGGLILNKERLVFQQGQLLNGKADLGGAIYNIRADVVTTSSLTSSTTFTRVINSLIQNNQALQGAVIFSESPDFDLVNLVIRDNNATADDGFLIFNQLALNEKQSQDTGSLVGLKNSTIFSNKGYVIKVMDGIHFVNNTMILNEKGLVFNAPFKKGFIANSILAKNGSSDCKVETAIDTINISNNLYGAGCGGSNSQQLGQTQLIASASEIEGKCDPLSSAILCPFKEYESQLLGYFRPRILASYTKLTDSPIVNKGPSSAAGTIQCQTLDQRGLVRPINQEICDRGAIELVVDRSTSKNVGKDIFYGEIAELTIADQLVDGELVTPSQCQQLFGNRSNGESWQPGCLRIEQTNTPSKGKITISQDGEIVYTPYSHWRGADEFKILVVTTTTRLNESSNPYIEIPAKIVQNPPDTFQDSKVKTSGGSLGAFTAIGLLLLMTLRRRR